MPRLAGKVTLVTGAARGIGAAIARAFAAEGAHHVCLTDIDDERGRATAATLGQAAAYTRLDVREPSDWQRVTAQLLEDYGGIDVVVNNAGITGFEAASRPHTPEHATLEDWRAVHRTNLDGTFLGCQYAIRAMRQTGRGAIINIASRSGIVGIPAAAAYAASKAAIRNHSKTVALYCAEQGLDITCNVISPAAILTPIWEPMLAGLHGAELEHRMAAFVADTPLRRFGRPEEVAALAVLLASDEARYMTGAELTIDGGLLAGSAASPKPETAPAQQEPAAQPA
jgi:NAD(P)-dependent dehydrogenase (short-subunit alcohol dehydrogenase family)